VPQYQQGYNVADYLLEVASDPPVSLFQMSNSPLGGVNGSQVDGESNGLVDLTEKQHDQGSGLGTHRLEHVQPTMSSRGSYAATFLTQFEVLSGREWKILRR
jgi:hypothetical protein